MWTIISLNIAAQDTCYQEETLGQDYMGHMSIAENNKTCQRWDANYPNAHSYVFFPDGTDRTIGSGFWLLIKFTPLSL